MLKWSFVALLLPQLHQIHSKVVLFYGTCFLWAPKMIRK